MIMIKHSMAKKIYLGADHAGFALKEKIKKWLKLKKIAFEDLGNLTYDKNDDYPDFAEKVGRKVAKENSKGLLFCGSSEGICIAANKIRGVRAVAPSTVKLAELSRSHNDANVLCLSGWYAPLSLSKKIVTKFLSTPFSTEARHVRRLNKIKKMEQK